MRTMFPLGTIGISPAALEVLQQANISPNSILERHVLGDWGDMTDSDKKTNELAVEMGGRILSAYNLPAYNLPAGTTVWVTTEPDRSATNILLPGEINN
jgi:hypothetical protein